MKNGFATVIFLFLFPVLFLAALLTYFSFDLVKNYSTFQNQCRDRVLNAQKVMGKNLQTLLDLNPQAEQLRTQEAFYRRELAASATPYEKAFWAGLLAKNIATQTVLRTQQESLVMGAQIRAQSILESYIHVAQLAQIPRAQLQIERSPKNAIAPDFKTVFNFEKLQTMEIRWRGKAFSNIFLKILPNLKQDLAGSCSATLKKGEIAWNPKINEDKFLSNSASSFSF